MQLTELKTDTPEAINKIEAKIVVPKEELAVLNDIQNFWTTLLAETEDEVMISKASENRVIQRYNQLLEQQNHQIKPGSQEDLKLYRTAQYLENQELVENRLKLIERITSYIESKKDIWKHKFSTSHSVQINQYDNYSFDGDGQESKRRDAIQSFAGQSRDSIYYVTNSGVTIRLKIDLLFHDDSTRYKAILRPPKEKIVFVNKITGNKDHQTAIESGVLFYHDMYSQVPTLGYNTEEFESQTLNLNSTNQSFQSPIIISATNQGLEVRNFSDNHSGHQVNKIWPID